MLARLRAPAAHLAAFIEAELVVAVQININVAVGGVFGVKVEVVVVHAVNLLGVTTGR